MYRFFRRFERLAFGIVTVSAIVCAGILVIHRFGDVSVPDFVSRGAADPRFPFVFVCEDVNEMDSCEQMQAGRTAAE
ncbi:hypothetical protein EVC45_14305 [Paraburkholderia sp. UYCP14C]|uniref:hypothetical protein n=1 Tax=Paraburkholderia sp. UYCP14C TaxID=2511130 RepID=UPI001020963E|nr:hypothetical protein [Paraburkholderia sp. UYCP14C]RZF28989.1 hypothetical protein EVC45_14305 [Paraburkholderia sp. UYCP14C]